MTATASNYYFYYLYYKRLEHWAQFAASAHDSQ